MVVLSLNRKEARLMSIFAMMQRFDFFTVVSWNLFCFKKSEL